MKSLKIIFILTVFSLWSCNRNVNQYKNGLPHGKWIYKASEKDFSTGRYSSGRPVGRWKAVADGKIYRKSRHRKNKEIIRFYHHNGTLKSKGMAKIDTIDTIHNGTLMKEVHWYYTGKWLHYDTTGRLLRVETYKQGEWIDDPWSKGSSH